MTNLVKSAGCGVRGRARFAVACLALFWCVPPAAATAQLQAIPGPNYFNGVRLYYAGEYKQALDIFERELRGAFKIGQTRWVDSICFHAMIAECHYQVGNYPTALDQYGAALVQFNTQPNWFLQVQFPGSLQPSNPGQIRQVPWGTTARRPNYAQYPDKFSVQQGQIDNSAVVQQGGVVQQARMLPVGVQEVARCTVLAIRRRRELLGPTAPYDPLLNDVLQKLSGMVAPPGNWSTAWTDVELGCALAAVGKDTQAKTVITRGLIAGGQYDHPLTGQALLELGRMELQQGKFAEAMAFYHEASIAAFQYLDPSVLEEAFRFGHLAHILANKPGGYPPVALAQPWAKQNNWEQLFVSLGLLMTETLVKEGNTAAADQSANAVRAMVARVRGGLGRTTARLNLLTAWIKYQGRNPSAGDAALAQALAAPASLWQFQVAMVDKLFLKEGRLNPREANELYARVLREPQPADWLTDPLESLVQMSTPHHNSYEVWLRLILDRKEFDLALEVSEQAKRQRFLVGLPLGGRLQSLVWTLESPEVALSQQARAEKRELLATYPAYSKLAEQASVLREKVETLGLPTDGTLPTPEFTAAWGQWNDVVAQQELLLREMAVRRLASTTVFPPRRTAKEIQASLGPKQAAYVFHINLNRWLAFHVTAKEITFLEIKTPQLVQEKIYRFLREMGHLEKNRPIPAANFAKDTVLKSLARELHEALLGLGRTDLQAAYEELVIVPDGPLWYLPFEALRTAENDGAEWLVRSTRIRYLPTAGLAVQDGRGSPRHAKTYLAVGQIHTQESPESAAAVLDEFRKDIPGLELLPRKTPPSPSALVAATASRLIVYDDVPGPEGNLLKWLPLPVNKGQPGADLEGWLASPWNGPDQLIFPGTSFAGSGATASKAAGQDVFQTVCGLLAAGGRTVVVSRWKTGGRSSAEIVREFLREVDSTTPVDAWQRAMLLASETPLDPSREPRVQLAPGGEPPSPDHPFFWSGMLLVDLRGAGPGESPSHDPAEVAKLKEKQRLLEELKRQEEERKKKEQEAKK